MEQVEDAWEVEVRRVCQEARAWLEERSRAGEANLAIVLDVDETSLSSRPALDGIDLRHGGQVAWRVALEWMGRAESAPIVPILELARFAVAKGYALFFVTGRPEHLREATARNLEEAGFPGWAGLVLEEDGARRRSASELKAPARCRIEEQGYRIVANVGDQESDLAGGFAERTFRIPNPFYTVP